MIFGLLHKGMEAVEDLNVNTNTNSEGSLPDENNSMVIEDVFTITGRGTVVTGRVKGLLKVNQSVVIERENRETLSSVITGIELHRRMVDCANDGDNCGIILRGIGRDQVERGDVIKSVQ